MACRIAILDSGIDLDFYENHVIKYVEYTEETGDESEYDSNGHGTLCCSAMLSINPDIQFVVIKILNENNLCSDERLLRALILLKDNPIVLKDGKVEAEGSHYELMQKSAYYRTMFERRENIE